MAALLLRREEGVLQGGALASRIRDRNSRCAYARHAHCGCEGHIESSESFDPKPVH